VPSDAHLVETRDEAFDAYRQAKSVCHTVAYCFDDDPLGSHPVPGACECLAAELPGHVIHSCQNVADAVHVCLGGDGSARLRQNTGCLPYGVLVEGELRALRYSMNGCIAPDDGFVFLGRLD
jgi:hypothetical protein